VEVDDSPKIHTYKFKQFSEVKDKITGSSQPTFETVELPNSSRIINNCFQFILEDFIKNDDTFRIDVITKFGGLALDKIKIKTKMGWKINVNQSSFLNSSASYGLIFSGNPDNFTGSDYLYFNEDEDESVENFNM
jgi:hypothetical protein